MALRKNTIDFTIGADPEFLCKEGNKIICSEDALADYNNYETEKFGSDGGGVAFEVRPSPSKDPLVIVNNILRIFTSFTKKEKKFLKFNWLAGSCQEDKTDNLKCPIGGHIHFGVKDNIYDSCIHLSNHVGAISLLIEDKKEALVRRGDCEYGGSEDYRVQAFGFEYRTLSSWLTSPYIAAAILCLSKTVMFEVINNRSYNYDYCFGPSDFTRMDTFKIKEKFPKIWENITKMALYQKYKMYIDILYFLVTNNLTWYPRMSMKEAWGLTKSTTGSICLTPTDLGAIWQRYTQSTKV